MLVAREGLEPSIFGFGGRCLIQLGHRTITADQTRLALARLGPFDPGTRSRAGLRSGRPAEASPYFCEIANPGDSLALVEAGRFELPSLPRFPRRLRA